MKIKHERDFWSGLMFIVTGLAFAAGAIINYNFGSSARPGPGYFPFGLGVLMAILGGVVAFKALTVESGDDSHRIGVVAWRPFTVITGAVVLFGWALPTLGLLIALPLLVFVASLGGDEFHPVESAINAAILTFFSWLVFIKGLGLVIPLLPSFMTA